MPADRVSEQPLPTEGREDVPIVCEAAFVDTLRERDQKGIVTYGRRLQTHNGRDAGRDAWEELVDLAQYLTQMRMERDDLIEENALLRGRIAELESRHA